jgi:hypothetical protein
LFTALEIEPNVIAWILASCLTSGFVLINTFFVWPKLLAAAYIIGALALVLAPKTLQARWVAALGGILVALGLLAHGGSLFAILGAVVSVCILRIRVPLRSVALLLAAAIVLYLPWLWYQKFYDPPGDRLLKLHLGDIQTVDSRPLGQALVDAYRAKTAKQIYDNKWSNWITAIDRNREYWSSLWLILKSTWTGDTAMQIKSAAWLRALHFLAFVPTLGFFGLGIPGLLLGVFRRFRTHYWRVAVQLSIFILVTVLLWCLLMFGPSTTVIHQGTYVTVLLALAACCLSLYSVSPNLARAVVALQALLTFVVYGPLMRLQTPEHHYIAFGELRVATLLTFIAATVATVWLLHRIAKGRLAS